MYPFDTHKAQHHDAIFHHHIDIMPYCYVSQIPTLCVRVCVCACVCMCVTIFPCQYPNNANPSIFSTVNKLHYTLCSYVRVCVYTLYSANCLLGEALVKSLYPLYIWKEQLLAN